MVARHGSNARPVAYFRACECREHGSELRSALWLEVVRLIAGIATPALTIDGQIGPRSVVRLSGGRDSR
jgi:hypothetical protein